MTLKYSTRKKTTILEHTLAIFGFSIITVIMLYPASMNFSDEVLGVPGDSNFFLWTMWWSNYSTFTLHSNPYEMSYWLYPNVSPFHLSSMPVYAGILTSPFQNIFGLVSSYNLILFLSFVLGGYGAFLLCRHFTKNSFVSFIGGSIFTFAPYHMFHAIGHMNMTSLEGIPFFVLFLFQMKEKDKKLAFLFAGISLAFVAFLGGLQYLYLISLFVVFFLIYHLITNRREIINKLFLTRFSLSIIIFLILASPFLLAFFENSTKTFANPPYAIGLYTADVANFFIPTPNNYFFSDYVAPFYSNWTISFINEGTVYIGYFVFALIIISLIKFRHENKFWHIIALIAGIFSLGPTLKFFGEQFHQLDFLMPGILLQMLPLATFRGVGRVDVITILAIGVISAVVLSSVFSKFQKPHFKLALISLIVLLIIIEYNTFPFPSYELEIPDFYNEIANDTEDYTILDIDPQHGYYDILTYATIHQKPLVSGFVNRLPIGIMNDFINIPIVHQERFLENKEFVKTAKYLSYDDNWSQRENYDQANICAFNSFDTRYIVLHKPILKEITYEELKDYLEDLLGKEIFSDKKITVFEYNSENMPCLKGYHGYLTTVGYDIFNTRQFPLWGTDEWIMHVYSKDEQKFNATLHMINLGETTSIQVFQEDAIIYEQTIPTEKHSIIQLEELKLKEGKNVFHLLLNNGPQLTIFFPDGQTENYLEDIQYAIWQERTDLQTKFPEVDLGELDGIRNWAKNEGWKENPRLSLLTPPDQSPIYSNNANDISERALLEVWKLRVDLQDAFPEVAEGNFERMKEYAIGVAWKNHSQLYPLIPKNEIPPYLKPRLVY